MAEKPTESKPALGISGAQVAGSALASVTAAVFASWAGTAGTLIGAALGSVFATAGAAIYTQSLRRSRAAMSQAALKARQTVTARGVAQGPARFTDEGERATPTRAIQTRSLRAHSETSSDPAEPGSDDQHRPAWGRVAGAALAVLVLALGSVTIVEAASGKPLSALFGKDAGHGTTLGHVVGSDSGHPRKQVQNPSPGRTTSTHTPNSSPGGLPSSVKPSERPTEEPSQAPSSNPSSAPSQEPSLGSLPTP